MNDSPRVHRSERQLNGGPHTCTVTDIVGSPGGPRLCVVAGMHVNEVSSIEATRRLERDLTSLPLTGTVSIISILNTPAWDTRSIGACPVDGKNINFCFPGTPTGSFSEQLAWELLEDWAGDAACFVDLHGGDLGEDIMRYSICQLTGDPEFDRRTQQAARCFDVDVVVALGADYLNAPGRSVTGLARRGRLGAFAEAGMGGIVAEENVAMHYDGVLRLAQSLGVLAGGRGGPTLIPRREARLVTDYAWLPVPATGWSHMHAHAGQEVDKDEVVATVESLDGTQRFSVLSPARGVVLWCDTHPAVSSGGNIAGIGFTS